MVLPLTATTDITKIKENDEDKKKWCRRARYEHTSQTSQNINDRPQINQTETGTMQMIHTNNDTL